MKVAIFTGGRGSTELTRRLTQQAGLDLTILINGYDDGASTGEIRRFLGDSLGPSDFRKNASRFATELHTCESELISFFDQRLPVELPQQDGETGLRFLSVQQFNGWPETMKSVKKTAKSINPDSLNEVANRLEYFISECQNKNFNFADCAIGNMVFAGCHLCEGRDFNKAVNNYCQILGLPEDLIINITDGQNLFLVALDRNNHFLDSEEDIVDSARKNQIEDIFLIDTVLGMEEKKQLSEMDKRTALSWLEEKSVAPVANHTALSALIDADLIIFSPGTQHSSLYPSYLTPGVGQTIAENIGATKLLITNIYEDAEIPEFDAVEISNRALHYLRQKSTKSYPEPLLITHSLINYPQDNKSGASRILPGDLGMIDDPRAIRLGNYEDTVSGLHDADKALAPFIDRFLNRDRKMRIGVLMTEATSREKIIQSTLQMVRQTKIDRLPEIDILTELDSALPESISKNIPFTLKQVKLDEIQELLAISTYDYIVLFESSGMYHGGDVIKLIGALESNDLDAVWGSRRLSVNDIHESYRLRYKQRWFVGAISYIGSHFLSLIYLFLFGRYISDTLSGVRIIRKSLLSDIVLSQPHSVYNQQLLSSLLKNRGEILEMPIRFTSQSPRKVKRTLMRDGMRAMIVIVKKRLLG